MTGPLPFIHEYKPPTDDDPRTLLMLHGTGGSQYDLIPIGKRLIPTAAILSPLGKVLENGMARFFRRFSQGVFDVEDIKLRATELTKFTLDAADYYKRDSNNFIGVGYSNGANMIAALLLLQPSLLRAAVMFRPMVPLMPPKLPNLDGLKVLICGGRDDELISMAEPMRLSELLRESKAEVDIHFANAGHGLTAEDLDCASGWLRKLDDSSES